MDNYLKQLMLDLLKLMSKRPVRSDFPDDDIENTVMDIQWDPDLLALLDTGPMLRLDEYTGITEESFPDEEMLTDGQLSLLLSILLEVLLHFRVDFYTPEGVPERMKYACLRSLWKYIVITYSEKNDYLACCGYDRVSCPFPGYCEECDDAEDDEPDDEDDFFFAIIKIL